jgi:hypothetical protein
MIIFLQSCKEDNEIVKKCPDNIIIIGKINQIGLSVSYRDTMIYSKIRGDSAEYFLDINEDQINDFKLTTYFNSSPCIEINKIYISSLSMNSMIFINDTIDNPQILSESDTISFYSLNWNSGKFQLCSYYSECELGSGIEVYEGIWWGIEKKYIGLMTETDKTLFYGWIEISILNNGGEILLHEIAFKNSCDN